MTVSRLWSTPVRLDAFFRAPLVPTSLNLGALDHLNAGGSTNGGQGIELAYRIARDHFIPDGTNRVILCTDGDFNVGLTSNDELIALVKRQAKSKVFLTCLGYGMGNYNDSMMEQISNKGNGIYGMIDSEQEARRVHGATVIWNVGNRLPRT